MSEFKGTPGPWRAVDRGIWDISIEADGTVCHVNNKGEWFPSNDGETTSGRSHNTMLADARLIAAAPELLEALETLLTEAENFSVSGVYFDEECMGHKGPALARAAIAKATGGTP